MILLTSTTVLPECRVPMIKNKECKYQVVEFITDIHKEVLFVGVPILNNEIAIFDQVYKEHAQLSVKEHNAFSNSLLSEKGL